MADNQRRSWETVPLDNLIADYVSRAYPGYSLESSVIRGSEVVLLLTVSLDQVQAITASPPEHEELTIARAILKSEESIKYVSYLDSESLPTGGIGHLLDRAELAAYPIGTTIPVETVDKWFDEDVHQAGNDAIKWLGPATWATLSSLRKALALGFAFQLGWDRMQLWGDTRDHIRAGEWTDVAAHLRASLMGRKQASQRTGRMAEMWASGTLLDRYKA